MRIKNSLNNVVANFLLYFIKTILAFIVRNILIKEVAQAYIGLNELYTNILMVLSIAELGISSAIGFSLYKPLIENDKKTISSIMTMFKKMYKIIGTIIFGVGLLAIPVLPYVVKEKIDDMYLIYVMFLVNSCCSYFISYKDILITSDQKSYKIVPHNIFFTIVSSFAEILILCKTKSFILYTLIKFLSLIIQRVVINRYISKEYKDINFDVDDEVPNEKKKEITENVKAMFFNKIGDAMVNGTDNIIISTFIGINTVSIYSNYLMITSYILSMVYIVYNGILASMGNFLVTETKERKYEMFKKTNFFGFVMFGFFAVILINAFNLYIEILANKNYLFGFDTVVLIVLNFYITGMRVPALNMKAAAGAFKNDKYTPVIHSIVNIVVSIILGIKYGINGVLLGTFFSSIYPSIKRPYVVFKDVLNQDFIIYIKEYISRFFFVLFVALITLFINSFVSYNSIIVEAIIKTIVAIAIFVMSFFILYRNNQELIFFKNFIMNFFKRRKV